MRPGLTTIISSIVISLFSAGVEASAQSGRDDPFQYQQSLIRSGQYLEALGSLRDSILYYNTRKDDASLDLVSEAYRMRGDICAYYLGRTDDAMQEYGKSIVARPLGYAAAVSHFQRGLVFYNRGVTKTAYREFAEMVKLFPGDEKAKIARDYMRLIKKQFREARRARKVRRSRAEPEAASILQPAAEPITATPTEIRTEVSTHEPSLPKASAAAPTTDYAVSESAAEGNERSEDGTIAPQPVVAALDTNVSEPRRPALPEHLLIEVAPEPPPEGGAPGVVNLPHRDRLANVALQRELEREFYRSPRLRSGVLIGDVPLQYSYASSMQIPSGPAPVRAPERIRVCLAYRVARLAVSASGRFDIHDAAGRKVAGNISAADFNYIAGKIGYAGHDYEALTMTPVGEGKVRFAGKRYRGQFNIKADGNGLDLINVLDLDSYLYGVLPREVMAGWPGESLKAQAVAARTYAMFQMNKSLGLPFDLDATVMSQVYGGFDDEQPTTNLAVDQTVGEIITFNNELIVAYFHSDSGGITEDAGNVWGLDFPYLLSFADQYSGPKEWQVRYSFDELQRLLKKSGIAVGRIDALRIADRGRSGRAVVIEVDHAGGTEKIGSNKFRLALGAGKLRSTLFELRQERRVAYFDGKGFGHGVGMSQNGAKAMADAGYNYRDILKFYYRGVQIGRMSDTLVGNRQQWR